MAHPDWHSKDVIKTLATQWKAKSPDEKEEWKRRAEDSKAADALPPVGNLNEDEHDHISVTEGLDSIIEAVTAPKDDEKEEEEEEEKHPEKPTPSKKKKKARRSKKQKA